MPSYQRLLPAAIICLSAIRSPQAKRAASRRRAKAHSRSEAEASWPVSKRAASRRRAKAHSRSEAEASWPVSARSAAFGLALLALGTGAKPYDDLRRHFRIELGEGWEIRPEFGDTGGMVFRRMLSKRRGGGFVLVMVRSRDAGDGPIEAYARAVETSLEREPGYERLDAREGRIAGLRAIVREYRTFADGAGKIEKFLRTYFAESEGRQFLLHVECRRRDWRRVRAEVESMLETFAPHPPPSLARRGGPDGGRESPGGEDAGEVERLRLIGRWKNQDGLVLELDAAGRFQLADVAGRYRLEEDRIHLLLPEGGRQTFTFWLDPTGSAMTLASSSLPKPITYRREGVESHGPREGSSVPPSMLVGTWRVEGADGPVALELRADGTFTLGEQSGRWTSEGDRLRFARSETEVVDYHVVLTGRDLILSEGDLDRPVTFERAR